MAFKGEINAEVLDHVKTGHAEGDIYKIIDGGELGGIPIIKGTFVRWTGTSWQATDAHYLIEAEIIEPINRLKYADNPEDFKTTTIPAEEASQYEIDRYYYLDEKIYRLIAKQPLPESRVSLIFQNKDSIIAGLNDGLNSRQFQIFKCDDSGVPIDNWTIADMVAAYNSGKYPVLVRRAGDDEWHPETVFWPVSADASSASNAQFDFLSKNLEAQMNSSHSAVAFNIRKFPVLFTIRSNGIVVCSCDYNTLAQRKNSLDRLAVEVVHNSSTGLRCSNVSVAFDFSTNIFTFNWTEEDGAHQITFEPNGNITHTLEPKFLDVAFTVDFNSTVSCQVSYAAINDRYKRPDSLRVSIDHHGTGEHFMPLIWRESSTLTWWFRYISGGTSGGTPTIHMIGYKADGTFVYV